MSLPHSNHSLRDWIRKSAGYVALAVFIFALQIGIPWVSIQSANKIEKLFSETGPDSWGRFASSRLRMDRLFHPKPQTIENVHCVSSAICGDELIALLFTGKSRAKVHVETFQLLRCDLRSGSINVTVAPSGIRYLLSDGKTIWQLPSYADHSEKIVPFVWEGKPAAIARCSRNRSLRCLIEFVDGHWVETDQFALIPRHFGLTTSPGEPAIEVCPVNDRVVTLLHSPGRVLFRALELGSEAQARATTLKQSRNLMNFMGTGEIGDSSWKQWDQFRLALHVKDRSGNPIFAMPDNFSNKDRPYPRLCYQDNQLFVVQTCVARNVGKNSLVQRPGFQCISLEDRDNESYVASSPIPWEGNQEISSNRILADSLIVMAAGNRALISDRGQLYVATAMDGRTYVLNFSRSDGRKVVMKLNDGEMQFVGQTGCTIDWLCYVDAAIAFGLFFVIPMSVLGLAAWVLEWRRGKLMYRMGHETTEVASIVRRGMARMIDQGLIAAIVIWAIASHPAALAWWLLIVQGTDTVRLKMVSRGLSWNSMQQSVAALQEYGITCLAAPCNWWIIAIAILVFSIQIVVQGRTGWSIGKWILGIRVVSTNLRPCGVARSLLREILVLGDGLLFVSWVPGAIAALATQHRQRLGDLMADTVVIRGAVFRRDAVSASATNVVQG